MEILAQTRDGPWIVNVLNLLMEWQLDNPDQDKEGAEAWVKENKDKLLRELP
jgi:ABC-type proline/glycine betaine transport system substrate-binding protein